MYGITPGPKEADSETFQNFMVDYVDDLIMLWEHSVIVRTLKYPEGMYLPSILILSLLILVALGRCVRVMLLAVCCDHPALCKSCGFAEHNHNLHFCTKCLCPRSDLSTPAGVTIDCMSACLPNFFNADPAKITRDGMASDIASMRRNGRHSISRHVRHILINMGLITLSYLVYHILTLFAWQ